MADWIVVHTTRTELEAGFLVSLLEAEGVPAEIQNANVAPLAGEVPMPEAEVQIRVPADRAAEAREIIAREEQERKAAAEAIREAREDDEMSTTSGWPTSAKLVALGLFTALVIVTSMHWKPRPGPLYSGKYIGNYRGHWNDEYVERLRGSKVPVAHFHGLDESGQPNRIEEFDPEGNRTVEYVDEDRDTFVEIARQFDPATGRLISESYDDNRDRRFERSVVHHPDGTTATYFDEDLDGIFDRREIRTERGTLLFTEIDRHREGFVRVPADPK